MWGKEEIIEYIKGNLIESRFKHTLSVAETAVKLAELNDVSIEKAEIAALAHDVAKNLTVDKMKEIIVENRIELSYDEEQTPELWHSIIAPVIGKQVFNIDDEEILGAMRWHTTGRENMTKLEKIIYVADIIEPRRKFVGIERIREATFKNLDTGVLMSLTHTIKYLLDRGFTIDINSIKARNYMILKK